jgi:3'-phosphoadenosine 5'-phosphosulfate sulfotransferase (PAPS reductase)/FAD synthetase
MPTAPEINLLSYETIIVAFSGGKDSLACLLHLLDLGVPRERIELWHHDVDGREGSDLMDWPVTRDYCRRVAAAFSVPIYFSWKVGGFEREMLRDNARTAPIRFEQPHGGVAEVGGTGGKLGTRRKFPQVSADLKVRWCSAYLKIDVCAAAIRNQARFRNARTLVVSGERAEESAARAKYALFEPDRADGRRSRYKRHVDRWRPVHAWSAQQVWALIERYCVNPHPAYRCGWGRVSCLLCIFGSRDQWASTAALAPRVFGRVADYEEAFGVTIQRGRRVRELVALGQPYQWSEEDARAALSATFDEAVILPEGAWQLPAGAFGESCGPT